MTTCARPHMLTPETAAMLMTARKGKGWTLHKAADGIGCNFSHIWRMEHSQSAPSTALAVDIIYAYALNQAQAQALMRESVPGVGRSKARRKAAA